MKDTPIALTIAGSDSCAGAGIQADLKTFLAFGVYGVCALTAVTSQNTSGVQDVYPLPPELIGRQLDTLFADFKIAALKTGMLWDSRIVKQVIQRVKRFDVPYLVVDPVLYAGDGSSLSKGDISPFPGYPKEELLKTIAQELLPLAYLVTPNLSEAEALCGFKLHNLQDMHAAAQKIQKVGCSRVLIKGGHLPGEEVLDLLYDGRKHTVFTRPRLKGSGWHGTGCALSAAITAGLSKNMALAQAVTAAIDYVAANLRQAFRPGQGASLLRHRAKP